MAYKYDLILVMKIDLAKPTRVVIHFCLFIPQLSLIFYLTIGEDLSTLKHHSAQVVFSTLLFEEIKLLEGFHSVDGKDEFSLFWHTETFHGILELNIVEDDGGNVGSVLLGKSFLWSGFGGGEEVGAVVLDGSRDFSGEFSSVVVSLGLGEGDSEREVLANLIKISLDGGEELRLWVLGNFSSFRSGSLMSGNILIRDGIGSNIRKGRDFSGA